MIELMQSRLLCDVAYCKSEPSIRRAPQLSPTASKPQKSRGFILNIPLLLLLLCSTALALDPNQPLSQLHHSTWNAKNGLDGSVTSLAQTLDGYLWIGTTDGLFRFDGLTFERYSPETGPLPSTAVSALLATRDGGLWIGYDRGGVTYLKQDTVINYSDKDGVPVSSVRGFVEDHDGIIWAAIVGGFARFDHQHWQKIRMDWNYPSKSARALLVDSKGTLWVGAGGSIAFLTKGSKTFQAIPVEMADVYAINEAPDGTLIFSDSETISLVPQGPEQDRTKTQLLKIEIPNRTMLFDHQGALWLCGIGITRIPFPHLDQGQQVFESGSKIERLGKKEGLTSDIVQAILEDREGNIWVGTDGGLDRFRYRNLACTAFGEDLFSFSLVAGENGDVWIGSAGTKTWPLMRVQDSKVFGEPIRVMNAYRDSGGTIWLSLWHRPIDQESVSYHPLIGLERGQITRISPPEEAKRLSLSANPPDPIIISSITRDKSGTLWISIGGCGEFQYRDGEWIFTKILEDHPDWSSNFAYAETAGRIWFSYGDRIALFDRGKIRTFTAADGLTNGPFSIITGRNNEIWVGGEAGLAFLANDRFHILRTNGPGLGAITGIVASANGDLWLSAGVGIVHIVAEEVRSVLLNVDHRTRYEVFDLISDLPQQLQRTGSYASGVVEGSDGLLWFATRSGVARIDPEKISHNPVEPPVSIKAVVADETHYSPFSAGKLPALTKNLSIAYTALSLAIPERVRFRYQLEGWDHDWQEAGSRREAFYTNLGPGDYVFHVIACNNDGVWNYDGARFRFSVAPAWYQTKLFYLACIVSVLLLVFIMYRLRVRQVSHALSARFDERLAERTRLAQELHDTFLQTIQGSKMVADDALEYSSDPVRLRKAIEQLAVWLGQATLEGRAALNSLRNSSTEENDLAQSFRLATENGMRPTAMTVAVSVVGPSDMHPIVRDEVYRIGYEAIRNAYAHSGADRLKVELKYGHDLLLRIADNGRGMDPEIVEKGKEGHFGLMGMRERALRIGAKLLVHSSPDTGTEILLSVPGASIFRHPPSRIEGIKQFLKRLRKPSTPQ